MKEFVLGVPQIVPESRCFECRICCRFPDTEKVQIPYWSGMEAEWAGESWFQKSPESPSLAPRLVRCGEEGYRCPAFDAGLSRCTIHAVKPLDCRLYPFVVAQHPGASGTVLAMDTKCPYIQEHSGDPELADYASRLTNYLSTSVASDYLKLNPQLAGPFWPEYVSVAALPQAVVAGSGGRTAPHTLLQPVRLEQRAVLQAALKQCRHAYSGYTLASLLGWNDLIPLWWMRVSATGAMSLFAGQAGWVFMPVPPLVNGRIDPVTLQAAWKVLEEANSGTATSRIEGIEGPDLKVFEEAGFKTVPGEAEYLYRTEALSALRGDRYRSQRWSINRLMKRLNGQIQFRPFRSSDTAACLQLYTRWAIRRQNRGADRYERALARDGLFFHRRLMLDHEAMDLTGWVAEVENQIVGYTLGGPVSSRIFCVFLEIGDPSLPGISQLLFREFCRSQEAYAFINAMGDSDLDGLRRAKRAYRPAGFARVYTAKLWS